MRSSQTDSAFLTSSVLDLPSHHAILQGCEHSTQIHDEGSYIRFDIKRNRSACNTTSEDQRNNVNTAKATAEERLQIIHGKNSEFPDNFARVNATFSNLMMQRCQRWRQR